MLVEIISVGEELLLGHTINSNAAFLSKEMSSYGFSVSRHISIGDEPELIHQTLMEALERADLVMTTGGLGPSHQDRTFEALGGLFSEVPEKLKNALGTAEGFFFSSQARALLVLPGAPFEMKEMFLKYGAPRIKELFGKAEPWHFKKVGICLLREVEVDPYLKELQQKYPKIEISLFSSLGTLQVVFKGRQPVDPAVRELEKRFPFFFYGEGKIEEAVQSEMIAQKKKLALAESCTGGAIAARLTQIPDASKYLLGSLVVYSNAWKERFLQVSHTTLDDPGAVSKEAVEEMCKGLLMETDADFAVAVSGIAGPSGGTVKKPVGTIYFAIQERGKRCDSGKIQAPPDRASAIELSTQTALGALWRRLAHNAFTFS